MAEEAGCCCCLAYPCMYTFIAPVVEGKHFHLAIQKTMLTSNNLHKWISVWRQIVGCAPMDLCMDSLAIKEMCTNGSGYGLTRNQQPKVVFLS
eukprot:3978354-Karenia_brevis.AAC.1